MQTNSITQNDIPQVVELKKNPATTSPDNETASIINPAAPKASEQVPLEAAVTQLNDYVQKLNRNLAFSIDEDSGRTVIKVTNSETDELIRQIPAEHTLKLAAALEKQSTQGLLLDAKA